MDNRGIINFRCWTLSDGQEHRWDSLGTAPLGGKGCSLGQEGTGERDAGGSEIFRGDVVTWSGVHFLIGYVKGAYRLVQLDGDWSGGVRDAWLHDCPLEEINVVGNSRANSEFVVHCLNARAKVKASKPKGS